MATPSQPYQLKLHPIGRAALKIGTVMARMGFPPPRGLVPWIVRHSWLLRVSRDRWVPVRVDERGRFYA